MRKPLFTGCGTALITPFKNGEVDYDALDKLVEDQIANGVSALIAAGTTGEPATMTWEEHLAVIRRVVEKADHRVPVIAGTGSNATSEAVYAAKAARMTGRDAMRADELGLYAYLFPMSENAFVCGRCRRQLQRIREYDMQNHTSLEQTARVYVENRMEIAATAKALFQHPNTVRYRLTKIQKLMGLEDDDALFAPMLSLMINLSRILEEEGRS